MREKLIKTDCKICKYYLLELDTYNRQYFTCEIIEKELGYKTNATNLRYHILQKNKDGYCKDFKISRLKSIFASIKHIFKR